MALTRTMLKGMDIDKENIDKIIEAHTETVDALKEARDEYKAKAEKLETEKTDIEGLKESMIDKSEYDSLKTKYDNLNNEYKTYKEDVANKATKASKAEAYKTLLKESGVAEKYVDKVLKVTDLEGVELDEQGAIKDADKLKEGIKSEWGEFIETKSARGAKTETPPANNGGKALTKEEIMKIKDDTERQRAWADYLRNNSI